MVNSSIAAVLVTDQGNFRAVCGDHFIGNVYRDEGDARTELVIHAIQCLEPIHES